MHHCGLGTLTLTLTPTLTLTLTLSSCTARLWSAAAPKMYSAARRPSRITAPERELATRWHRRSRCGGSEAGQTYDEVVTSPQKPTDPAIPVEALYDEILSLREQVARMEAGGAFALQDELDRLRRRLDTADDDLGAPLPPPEDAPLEYEEIGGRDSAPTLSAADRESAAARLSRGGPRQRTASRATPRE